MRTPKGRPELVPTHAYAIRLVVQKGRLVAVKLMLDGMKALRGAHPRLTRGPTAPVTFEGVAQTGTWLGAPAFVDVRGEVIERARAHRRAHTNGHGRR